MRSSLPQSMVSFQKRRFRLDRPGARAILELHAAAFLEGANIALQHDFSDIHEHLSEVDEADRGFAYEGAGMIAALFDMTLGAAGRRARRTALLLDGPGRHHIYLVHVGAGWCGRYLPMLRASDRLAALDGLNRWLALDGEGFARSFFARGKPRIGAPRSARHAIMLQGTGRSLWFREAADPAGIAGAIGSAPAAARPELWSGVGLAAAFAGGATSEELADLAVRADGHWPDLAQGVAFAAEARRLAGHVPPHTALACEVLVGAPCPVLAEWTRTTSLDLRVPGAPPESYQEWRRRVRAKALSLRPAAADGDVAGRARLADEVVA